MWTERIISRADLKEELKPGAFALAGLVIHNESVVLGTGPIEITTPREQWAFAVTFPFRVNASDVSENTGSLLIRVEATVERGRIGVGYVTRDLKSYITPEVERSAGDGATTFDLLIEGGKDCGCLVVRNTAEDVSSRVVVHSIRTFKIETPRRSDLIEVETVALQGSECRDLTRAQGEFTAQEKNTDSWCAGPAKGRENEVRYSVLLTHTSRNWDWTRCTREFFIKRYSDPHRLRNLPPFEELSSNQGQQFYSGGMTLLELAIDGRAAHVTSRRCIDSRFKIQHGSYVGKRLVLCFEDFLCVIPDAEDSVAEIDLRPGSEWRVDDNWFGGLHTVFPVDDNTCIVSSSAADAVLWVNLVARRVVRRWRLPTEIYGANYELTPDMSVSDHYIPNDMQLAHLNCAYPDGKGGCYVSTLIQGDIGHVDLDGKYSILGRDYIGCHGVRLSRNSEHVYFTDSCTGRLMRLKSGGGAIEMHRVDSQWLHDIEQVEGDLYWFCLGDKNEAALIDVGSHRELGRFAFGSRGANVQFVTIQPKD
jgi:hypothetical protein